MNPKPTAWFQRSGSPSQSAENTMKIVSVITSWMVLSWAALK